MALRTPLFNDAKTYGFEWLRAMFETTLQEGVIGVTDLKATAAAGGGMKLDIAAGTGLVKGDSGVPGTGLSQGLFLIVNDAAVANAVTLTASDGSLPRIDQVCLRVRDSADLGSGADDAIFEVVTGVATSGATLDNRNGAAALGNDRLRLADVLVPAGSSSVSAGNVRDRRPWARGAYSRRLYTGGSKTTTSGSYGLIDSTNLQPRLECSGVPLRVSLRGNLSHSSVGHHTGFQPWLDGATADGLSTPDDPLITENVAGNYMAVHLLWDVIPAAGSHLIGPAWRTTAATATLYGVAGQPARLVIEEILRSSAENT